RVEVAFPALTRAHADVGLRQVIQHETLPWQRAGELRRGRQMVTVYENVVREAELLEQGQALKERGPEQEPGVGLALRDVPDAYEHGVTGERFELAADGRRLKIHPAND